MEIAEVKDFIKQFMLLVNEEKEESVLPVKYEGEKYYLWVYKKDNILVASLERQTVFKELGEIFSVAYEKSEDGKLKQVKLGFFDQKLEFDIIDES